MKLKYNRGQRNRPGPRAMQEGWPPEDHDEPDEEIAKAKVASGSYSRVTESKGGNHANGG